MSGDSLGANKTQLSYLYQQQNSIVRVLYATPQQQYI